MLKGFNLRRCALAVCMTALWLAGCSGSQMSTTSFTGMTPVMGITRNALVHGGLFSGKYSGAWTFGANCGAGCIPFVFTGSGKGTFVGKSKETVDLTCTTSCAGSATIDSDLVPANEAEFVIGPTSVPNRLCLNTTSLKLNYTVSKGLGKFRHAFGSGLLTINCSVGTGSAFPYSDAWSGTLNW